MMRQSLCAIVLLLAPSALGQQWEAELCPDQDLADLRPKVAWFATGEANVEVRDGRFVFKARGGKAGAWIGIGSSLPFPGCDSGYLGDVQGWDGRQPTTVEARFRVVPAKGSMAIVAQLQVSDGWHGWTLSVGAKGIQGLPFDATTFHTYRITAKGGVANLCVDGKLAPEGCLRSGTHPRNALLVGDISSGSAGVSEWEFVRWTNREATPWSVPDEVDKRIERERVVVGDRPGDVQELRLHGLVGPVATLPDGRLMSWYVVGKTIPIKKQIEDPSIPQRAYAMFSNDNGSTWSPPRLLFEFPRERGARTDGVILVSRAGAIHLFGLNFFSYGLVPKLDHSKCKSYLWHARSVDRGKTWTPVQDVGFGGTYTGATNSVIQLGSGRILVPISRFSRRATGRFVSVAPYSDDDGVTWRPPTDKVVVDTGGAGSETGACEPVAVELKDGRIWMLIRAQDGYQWQTFSSDGGLHWEPPRHSHFVSTNSPVATLRLRDGRILLVWNNCGLGRQPGIRSDRFVVAAAISKDEGRTWQGYREIARLSKSGTLAYPFVTQASDGSVIVVLYHGRRMLRLAPDFLEQTSLREDFADGIARWCHVGTEGVEIIASPDDGGRVMCVRKPKPNVPSGACLNFPFGASGRLRLSLRVEPGFKGAKIAMTDHFSLPGLDPKTCFALRLTAGSGIELPTSEDRSGPCAATLDYGKWHNLLIEWDCGKQHALVSLDGHRSARVPQLASAPGVCYLRVQSTAQDTDMAGLLIQSVEVDAHQKSRQE